MKVCVYAICKNEEKFVDRWYQSMKEADEIYVLDTGSNDKTVYMLKDRGVNVQVMEIDPWRFDVARNKSLDLVPDDTDICVCTDLDEVFNSGWRCALERAWRSNTNRLRYIYNWSMDENKKPIITFYYEKIHSRRNYKWIHPVHEILEYSGKYENYTKTDEIVLSHFPDKKKSRGSYLSLLELSVKEEPFNDRNMHYLGREYMYYKRYEESIDTLKKHLNLATATWKDERCASMRFISRCYIALGDYEKAKEWLLMAIEEAPHLRDPYVEMALLYYYKEEWLEVIKYATLALSIKEHQMTYINEVFSWNYTIDDLLSLSYYYLGLYDIALFYVDRALEYGDDERLFNNKKIMLEKSKE